MEITVTNYQAKRLTFSDWEKYIVVLLDVQDNPQAPMIFYKCLPDGYRITTSYQTFIIYTEISYLDICKKYENTNLQVYDVTASPEINHPAILKFKAEFLERAIPEI